ncbi:MAG: hypothetical protein ABJE95_31725 [Byssovorax sp.]
MLKIRKEQKQAFARRELEGFQDRMIDHLGALFPAYCEPLGEPAVRRLIELGVERAARHGVVTERGVCVYLDVMFAFGRDFEADPALPWARAILVDRTINGPLLRADALFEAAFDHLDEARGLHAQEAS